MKSTLVIILLIFVFPLTALEEDLLKCSLEEDKDKRLTCYDQLVSSISKIVKEKKTTELQPGVEVLAQQELSTSKDPAEKVIQEQKKIITTLKEELKEIKTRKKPVEQAIQDESFFATLISVEYRNYRYYFELDNGQRWSTSDTGTRAKLKSGQKIEIVRGAFGASFLKNSKGKFRLKKVR